MTSADREAFCLYLERPRTAYRGTELSTVPRRAVSTERTLKTLHSLQGDPDAALPASALYIGFCAYLTLNTIAAQVCLQAIPRRTVNRRWSGRD